MRELCLKCLRPLESCYCKYIKQEDYGIKFVFLMHPKEAKKQRTGTGRLANLSLYDSEIIVGVDFSENKRLNELLADEKYFPVLLYPKEDALTSESEKLKSSLINRKLLVIVIDSTWFCSKKMVKLSKNLHKLPAISFTNSYKSIFTFKKEPKDYCVSTIESCYYLIKELQEANISSLKDISPEPLMYVFKKMIQFQLEKENERIELGLPGNHAYDYKYTRKREIPKEINNTTL